MLCLDDPDRAAEIIIDRLADDSNRQQNLETFIEHSITSDNPPFLAELQRRAAAVRARLQVQAALNAVGRTITMNGASNYWGDF